MSSFGTTASQRDVKLPRVTGVKNKQAAPTQVRTQAGNAGSSCPPFAVPRLLHCWTDCAYSCVESECNAGIPGRRVCLCCCCRHPLPPVLPPATPPALPPQSIPSALQITAEQILRESKALQEAERQAPTVKITDPEELAEYRLQARLCPLPRPLMLPAPAWVAAASGAVT